MKTKGPNIRLVGTTLEGWRDAPSRTDHLFGALGEEAIKPETFSITGFN